MAQSNVIVKLSLKDAEVVRRGLEALGADGEKALRRIDAAGRAPSAGLKALGAASDELKGKLGGVASQAGIVGTSLGALGPAGMAAAVGIGVMVAALSVAINKAREAGEFFAKLGDDAERAGTSASKLATIQGVFIANAASADEANSALVRLRATIDDAMSGNDKAQQSFQNVGVSMEWLSRNGGDTVDVLIKIAQHGGLTAGQLNDLTGKIGNALIPAMQELSKVGVQANTDFDALTKQINETKDRIEILDRQMNVLAMQGGKTFLETVAAMKQGLVDLTGWFLRTAEANATMWQRLGKATMKDWLWGDPIKDAMNARNEALEAEKKKQDDFKAIVAGQVKIEQAVRSAPTPYAGSINPPKPPKPKKAPRAAAKQPEYIDMTTGKATTPNEDQLYFLAHPPKPRRFQDLEAFEEAADGIEKRNDDLMASLQRAWLQASNQRIGLIELDRDAAIAALDEQELSEEQHAQAVATIRQTANMNMATEAGRLADTTDKTTEATYKLSDTFQGFGQVASSAFEDAIIKGGKFSDVLNGLAEDIQRLLIRNTLNKFLDIAINAGASAISGYMGGASGTYASQQTTADWTSFKGLRRQAHGNAFDYGNVIPFARGGVVSRPTLFPMARGMGLMGEAGPEAVVPLKRMPSGNLGVEGGGGVTVNIINNTPSKVSTEKREGDPKGGINLNVVIDSLETAMAQRLQRPGSQLNRAMATAANPIKAR